ncbi:MAG: PorT family protein [Paludibacter sp.]|jgi:hypothetical protein|nr:PorT family protein [Paludibacter sp.]
MKKIKILLLSVLLIAAVNCLYSQKFSVEAGYVQPKSVKSAANEGYPNYFHGERIGVNVQFYLKYNFSLLTGALYSVVYGTDTQGPLLSDTIYNGIVRDRTFMHSVSVPLRVNYFVQLPKDIKLFAFAGPNVNIGLGASRDRTVSLTSSLLETFKDEFGMTYKTGVDDLYKNALIHRINFQLGAGGGIQWKNYQLKAGYDFGINNLSRIDIYKLHTSGWWVSFAYQF